MARTMRINPEGEFEIGTRIDDDGEMFVRIDLPDRRSGDRAELTFNLASFVYFADWVRMVADELIDETKG